MGKVSGPLGNDLLPNSQLVAVRFHVAKQFNGVVDDLREETTREYEAQLSKAQQKRFRPMMEEFRRDPKELKPEGREALERLFAEIPVLKHAYEARARFEEIFDTPRIVPPRKGNWPSSGRGPNRLGSTSPNSGRPTTTGRQASSTT